MRLPKPFSVTDENAVCARFVLLGRDGDADDIIVLGQVDAAHAVGGAAHGAHIVLVKADRHAQVRGEKDDLAAVGDARLDQLVVFVDADGDNAARHDVGEVLERRLLDGSLSRGEEDELAFFFKIADGQNGADIFAGLQVEQALHGLALACRAHVGNLVDLEPVDAAGVGEAEQKGVGRVRR